MSGARRRDTHAAARPAGAGTARARRRTLLAAALALAATARAARAQTIEVLPLRWRSAEELLPLLQPLVEPGGALTGRGSQLFLRASAANRREIEALVAQLDTRPRQLRLTLRRARTADDARAAVGAQGGVVIGSRGGAAALSVEGATVRSTGSGERAQTVNVLEGARASIAIGAAVPLTFRQWVWGPQGPTEIGGAVYAEAVSQLGVRARLSGDWVTLELTPADARIGAAGIERTQWMTTVQGRLGEWLVVGAASVRDGARAGHAESLWVRVDLADGGDPPAR